MPLATKYKLDEASMQILEQHICKNSGRMVIVDDNILIEITANKQLKKVETCKRTMNFIDNLQQIQNLNLIFDQDFEHKHPSFLNLVICYLQVKTKISDEKNEQITKKLTELETSNKILVSSAKWIEDNGSGNNYDKLMKQMKCYEETSKQFKGIEERLSTSEKQITELLKQNKSLEEQLKLQFTKSKEAEDKLISLLTRKTVKKPGDVEISQIDNFFA